MKALVTAIYDKKLFILAFIGLLISAPLLSYLVFSYGGIGGVFLFLPLLLFSIFKFPRFGIIFYLLLAYTIMFIVKLGLIAFPLGTLMDGLLLILFICFLFNHKTKPRDGILKNPISIIILVWVSYNIFQVINPNAASRVAWIYTVRSLAAVMLSYYVFLYYIDSVKFIKVILKIWLGLSLIAVIYAFKQEYFGFSSFEEKMLEDPLVAGLLFIDGHWRKFSIFADPVSFSYNMSASAILCVSLMFGPLSLTKKIMLSILAGLFLFVMLFSGTRSAYILFPAAMLLLFILKMNFKYLIAFGVFFVAFGILVNIPTSNYTLYRFQTAFKPSDDASYNVRAQNQKMIQPYIVSHPFGGGLGSTGASGVKFSPYSFLASFPPDSGFMRAAVEQGWIGLILLCTLFFLSLKKGIDNYFRIIDPELKSYCLAMTLIVFAMFIGNFPQEGILQYPLNVFFCLCLALINASMFLSQKKEIETN